MERALTEPDGPPATSDAPSVMVVLTVANGARWLPDCMSSLAAQTYDRVGVVAVDFSSADGSRDILQRTIGGDRVIAGGRHRSVPLAMKMALDLDAVREADYLLIMHDDVAPDAEAVSRLVDAARDVEGAGVVGPKVVDWDDATVLREIGLSSDRFGHLYSPLEADERDHGQYDRIKDVLFVSSCAMLVSRAVWQRAGLPDERLGSHEDLDFCWRARLAGFRVLVSPAASVRHREATSRGERGGGHGVKRDVYLSERAGLAATLKNYGLVSELWVQPLYALQGLVRLALLLAARSFEDAYQLLGAWVWNATRLPGTIARRVRAQSVRVVPDRSIRRFMAPEWIRLRRWLEAGGTLVAGDLDVPEEEEAQPVVPLRARAASVARGHPVAAAWVAAAVLCAFAYRHLTGPGALAGGVLPHFPSGPADFFRELISGVKTTGLGGAVPASPALALLGGSSAVLFGNAQLAEKVLLMGLPLLAAAGFYRAFARHVSESLPRLAATACYVLSPLSLWMFSQGRIASLVSLAVLPVLWDRLTVAFGSGRLPRKVRFLVGTGAFLAIGVSFFPGILLVLAIPAAMFVLGAERGGGRIRGLGLVVGAVVVGAVLAFPSVLTLIQARGVGLASAVGRPRFGDLVRLVVTPDHGAWAIGWFLPIAAGLSLAVVKSEHRGKAIRLGLCAIAGIGLAWASAAGYLPAAFSNAQAFLSVTAFAYCGLVGFGIATLVAGIERHAFGVRQFAIAAVVGSVAGGLLLQGLLAAVGTWDVGPGQLPPAWPLVAGSPGATRVLWIGAPTGMPFPAPGGDPTGEVQAGPATLRYALTDRTGTSALDIGRQDQSPASSYLTEALSALLSGGTVHGGALLAPLGVGFVVAGAGDLPSVVLKRLSAQVDLDLIPAGGLIIYRNARALPPASVVVPAPSLARGSAQLAAAQWLPAEIVPMKSATGGWDGTAPATAGAAVWIAGRYTSGWVLHQGGTVRPAQEGFGWGTTFALSASTGPFDVRYSRQRVRTAEMAGLAALWLCALWITRKPATRRSL